MEQLHSSWHKKGRAEGRVEATRAAILEFVETRFEVSAENIAGRLERIGDLDQPQALRRAVFGATSQEEALSQIKTAQGGI